MTDPIPGTPPRAVDPEDSEGILGPTSHRLRHTLHRHQLISQYIDLLMVLAQRKLDPETRDLLLDRIERSFDAQPTTLPVVRRSVSWPPLIARTP